MLNLLKRLLEKVGLLKAPPPPTPVEDESSRYACCSDDVHIAYRGLADDRLYISRDRKWQEVQFFKANGLRVFCAKCRHRVL